MANFIVSRYNQDVSWLSEYCTSAVMFDRSDNPLPGSNIVPNLGTDIADKLLYIILNYNNLPSAAVYTKANLFKYLTKEEFDKVKDNSFFTPLLTKNHEEKPGISFYMNGIYWEKNNMWYLASHPCKHDPKEVMRVCGIENLDFVPFAPGSNYILTPSDIHKHPIEFYQKLYNYVNWAVYPGEAQIIERALYTIWR